MASLNDYARAHGAGPVQRPVLDLRNDVVRAARDWDDAVMHVRHGVSYAGTLVEKERALHAAVRALEDALNRV